MGDARTGRPFCSRYARCSCKSISTEVSARDNTIVQNNIATPRTTLTVHLNPRAMQKSQPKSLLEWDEYQPAHRLAFTVAAVSDRRNCEPFQCLITYVIKH